MGPLRQQVCHLGSNAQEQIRALDDNTRLLRTRTELLCTQLNSARSLLADLSDRVIKLEDHKHKDELRLHVLAERIPSSQRCPSNPGPVLSDCGRSAVSKPENIKAAQQTAYALRRSAAPTLVEFDSRRTCEVANPDVCSNSSETEIFVPPKARGMSP